MTSANAMLGCNDTWCPWRGSCQRANQELRWRAWLPRGEHGQCNWYIETKGEDMTDFPDYNDRAARQYAHEQGEMAELEERWEAWIDPEIDRLVSPEGWGEVIEHINATYAAELDAELRNMVCVDRTGRSPRPDALLFLINHAIHDLTSLERFMGAQSDEN